MTLQELDLYALCDVTEADIITSRLITSEIAVLINHLHSLKNLIATGDMALVKELITIVHYSFQGLIPLLGNILYPEAVDAAIVTQNSLEVLYCAPEGGERLFKQHTQFVELIDESSEVLTELKDAAHDGGNDGGSFTFGEGHKRMLTMTFLTSLCISILVCTGIYISPDLGHADRMELLVWQATEAIEATEAV